MKSSSLVAAALVAVVMGDLSGGASERLNRGHILVHKSLSAPATRDILVFNKNFTVTYTVLNVGLSSAMDVKVWVYQLFERAHLEREDDAACH